MTESDKSEACLNAFLNGLNADLADKLYAAPDVENSFEVAVSRKDEKSTCCTSYSGTGNTILSFQSNTAF